MKLKALSCFCLLVLVASNASAQHIPSTASSGSPSLVDWPQFNFDPALDGYNPYESVLNPANVGSLVLRWRYPTNGRVCSSPVIANGILYVGTDSGFLYALNAGTGALIWTFSTTAFPILSPAVANGIVYVPAGDLYALDANTGTVVWQVPNAGQTSPTVVNNTVYTVDAYGDFLAVNAQTGTRSWSFRTGTVAAATPAVANGMAYVTAWDGSVRALNASTGATIWARGFGSPVPKPTPYRSVGGLSVANGTVYVAVANSKSQQASYNLYALNGSTGATIWESSSVGRLNASSTPAVANGLVFVGANQYTYAFNASTGAQVWQSASFNGGNPISPIVANGVVYVESWSVLGEGLNYFTIDALDAGTGNSLWEHTSGVSMPERWPTPAVVNGVLYGTANDQNDFSTAIGAFGLPSQ